MATKTPTGIGFEKPSERARKVAWECARCKIISGDISQTLLEFQRGSVALKRGSAKVLSNGVTQFVAEAGLVDLLLIPMIAVARDFRRVDFPRDWQAKPRPGKTGTSYNFGAAGRLKTTASIRKATEPGSTKPKSHCIISRVPHYSVSGN